jgi:hypothetical protein
MEGSGRGKMGTEFLAAKMGFHALGFHALGLGLPFTTKKTIVE